MLLLSGSLSCRVCFYKMSIINSSSSRRRSSDGSISHWFSLFNAQPAAMITQRRGTVNQLTHDTVSRFVVGAVTCELLNIRHQCADKGIQKNKNKKAADMSALGIALECRNARPV